jgi:hypothetical protein
VTQLLKSGADINIHNRNNKTPLDLALDNNKLYAGKLLAEGMGIADSQEYINLASLDAASQGSLPSVTRPSLGHGNGPNTSDERRTSLHTASEAGHLEIVRSFLEVGEDSDVNERDGRHWTPLFLASKEGRIEVAKLLIEYGADVNSLDWTGWTPLLAASLRGHPGVVHLLLNHGADVNARHQDHRTALHLALHNPSLEIVKALLKKGADVHVRNDVGQTPLQMASRRGARDIVQLLSEYGASDVGH